MNINLKLCLLETITLGAILVSPSAACADDEAVFSDIFDGKLADGWTWLREDADAWRIKDDGLEIRKIPECALAADAQLIVSGDSHLLDLSQWQNIQIISPATLAFRIISHQRC